MTVLISGAAGKTGQAIIKALLTRKAPVRAFIHRPEYSARLNALGVTDIVLGDMQDATAYQQAATGVTAIYHICPNMHPNEVSIGQNAITAAQQTGVQQVVYHSVLHPQTEKMPHHWYKMRVEELLFESGLNFTILQPVAYMQNILGGWQSIVAQGLYRVPYPVNTRLAMVNLDDVAEVAAMTLTGPSHTGAVYELVGPDNLSQTEVAQILSDSLNRPVEAQQIPLDEWRAGAKSAGLGRYQLDTLSKMFQYYEEYQFLGNANVLSWLLNRPPTDFRMFIAGVK